MPASKALPTFIPPMLAKAGEPFDSPEHSFEVKWDGTRCLAFTDGKGEYRLLNRRRIDMTERYPELEFLGHLPAGSVLDGEIVVLKGGKPDFAALQSRDHAVRPLNIRFMGAKLPATYIVFDLLYADFRPVMDQPLSVRRERLAKLIKRCDNPRLVFSESVIGSGKAYFQAVCRQGLEGVIAKRLDTLYQPGKRTGAWLKIKQRHAMLCAVIGFLPEGKDDFRSLLLATEDQGQLSYVGRVGSGIDAELRAQLNRKLWPRVRSSPVIPCPVKALWVEPEVYCRVMYFERTRDGQLRAPVFGGICNGD